MRLKKILTLPQYLLPQHFLSRFFGWLANSKTPWIKRLLITWFTARYKVNLQDAEIQNPKDYPTFNAFFTRAIRLNLRPMPPEAEAVVSPADGFITQIGTISTGKIIQAKGFDFTTHELLGCDKQNKLNRFERGKFVTIYLSPKDYHRCHFPLNARLTAMTYIPGKLFSVNQRTTDTVENLFTRNERVACFFETQAGPMAVVLVGAFFVASISTSWYGTISPFARRTRQTWSYQNLPFNRGDLLGHFAFGSTVIVLFGENTVQWRSELQAGSPVLVREKIGQADLNVLTK